MIPRPTNSMSDEPKAACRVIGCYDFSQIVDGIVPNMARNGQSGRIEGDVKVVTNGGNQDYSLKFTAKNQYFDTNLTNEHEDALAIFFDCLIKETRTWDTMVGNFNSSERSGFCFR